MELDKIYNMDAFDGMKQIPDNIYPVDDYSPGTNAPPLDHSRQFKGRQQAEGGAGGSE